MDAKAKLQINKRDGITLRTFRPAAKERPSKKAAYKWEKEFAKRII